MRDRLVIGLTSGSLTEWVRLPYAFSAAFARHGPG
jgi:hypothetical protein